LVPIIPKHLNSYVLFGLSASKPCNKNIQKHHERLIISTKYNTLNISYNNTIVFLDFITY